MEDKAVSKKKRGKSRFVPETLQNIERTGAEDYTKNIDITGDVMLAIFGFKGGEFGNWTSQAERQENLNMCFNALHDLADVLKMDTKDISLGGDLSIAFGARGRGNGALAHYEPTYKVINLTKETVTRKTGGAGALAHEWGHALDAKLGDLAGFTCKLLSDRYSEDRYRTSRAEGASKTALEIFEAMKYKTAPDNTDYEARAKKAEEALYRAVNFYKPFNLSSEQDRRWREALKALADDPPYLFMSDKDKENINKLSAIRKEAKGHVINAKDRETIEYRCSQLCSMRNFAKEAKTKPRECRVETDFYKGSQEFDKIHSRESKGYWASSCEMFARAFDCYVADKLKEAGIRDDYLTAYSDAYKTTVDGKRICAVPEGEERQILNALFDKLVTELHEKELFHEPVAREIAAPEMTFAKQYIGDKTEGNMVTVASTPIAASKVPDYGQYQQLDLFTFMNEQDRTR